MQERIEDRNLTGIQPLVTPREVKRQLPLSDEAAARVGETRTALRDILHGRDPKRIAVVVGPCSIHDPDAALEYGQKLRRAAESLSEQLVVVMRTYFEKPRTTVGWKGLVNDPHLDDSCDVEAGLFLARRLLLDLNEAGVACGSEVLDPFTPQFLADLLAWSSIGARTSESQTHRQLASGLSMPVGFKNGTDGQLATAQNAVVAARHAHSFLGITADGRAAVVRTRGNPDAHLVLRGGGGRTNYDAESVAAAARGLREPGAARPVLVDCSHDNSGKDHREQPAVAREVARQIRSGGCTLLGVLLESNLLPGRQDWRPSAQLRRGVSITDACMGWNETEDLLCELAEAVKLAP